MARPKAEEQLKKPVRVALYIEAEQREQLRALARATGKPWARYVREAVRDVLVKYRRRPKR